jgi:hypothetical protein
MIVIFLIRKKIIADFKKQHQTKNNKPNATSNTYNLK